MSNTESEFSYNKNIGEGLFHSKLVQIKSQLSAREYHHTTTSICICGFKKVGCSSKFIHHSLITQVMQDIFKRCNYPR